MMMARLLFTCSVWLGLACSVSVPSIGQAAESTTRVAPKISSSELARRIDQRFTAIWKRDGVSPPPLVDDATFMRRTFLDLVGTIPSVSQVRDFLEAQGTFKREDLVDQLLNDDSRPQRLASRSSEHLARIFRRMMIPKSSVNANMAPQLDPWLRDQFAENVSYDVFTHRLIAASDPAGSQVFAQALGGTPVTMADGFTRYFLGVRIGCAQCHDHPFNGDLTQADFWGMAAFFGPTTGGQIPAISDEAGNSYSARFLWGGVPEIPDDKSPREVLADWMVAPANQNFSATAVNRIWQHLCGRGLVTAVDDLDQATDEERTVLDELGGWFAESGYNVRWLIEGICKSEYYQRASLSQEAEGDARLALRPLKTLTPEQVFDSLEQALALPIGRVDNPPRYNGMREAFVARMDEAASESPEDFGAGIPQALMIMNGQLTADATSLEKSRTLRAVVDAPFLNSREKIEVLFLVALTRVPSNGELEFLLGHIQSQPSEIARGRAYEDVFWGLLNSPEFVLSR